MLASRIAVSVKVVTIAVVIVMTAAVFTPMLLTMAVVTMAAAIMSVAWRWGTTPHSLGPETQRVVVARSEAVLGSGS